MKAHPLDKCPKCEAPTIYRDRNGLSLECSKCDWIAVEIVSFAEARKPKDCGGGR